MNGLGYPISWLTIIALSVLAGDALILFLILRQAILSTMSIKSKNAAIGMFISLLAIVATAELIMAFAFWNVFLHQLPLLPLLTRAMLVVVFFKISGRKLSPTEEQRGEYRTIVLGLMAITFAGLMALSIVNAQLTLFGIYPFYYMLLSFVCLYLTLAIQSYKIYRWQEQLGAALLDSATLSLFLSLIAVFHSGNQLEAYERALALLILGAWLADHLVRLVNEFQVAWNKFSREKQQKLECHKWRSKYEGTSSNAWW